MQPNVDNINQVIAAIQAEENYFSMASFYDHSNQKYTTSSGWCGTPSCIGGWAAWIASNGELTTEMTSDDVYADLLWTVNTAADFLGIIGDDAYKLFHARDDNGCVSIFKISRSEAIKTLEIFRDTAVVDWSHTEHYSAYQHVEEPA